MLYALWWSEHKINSQESRGDSDPHINKPTILHFYASFEDLECPRMKNPCLIFQLTHLSVIYTSRCLCAHHCLSPSLTLKDIFIRNLLCQPTAWAPPTHLTYSVTRSHRQLQSGTLFAVLDLLFVSIYCNTHNHPFLPPRRLFCIQSINRHMVLWIMLHVIATVSLSRWVSAVQDCSNGWGLKTENQ